MLKNFFRDSSVTNNFRKDIYRYIHASEPVSKVDLLAHFDATQTTMTRLIDDLENRKLIRRCGYGKSIGGRPPVLYEINRKSGYVFGVEIARTHVKIVLLDASLQMVEERGFPLTPEDSPNITVSKLILHIHKIMKLHNVSDNLMIGIGIGSVGPIDRREGVIVNPESFPAKGWKDVPIVKMLNAEFSVPVTINNGANTAALAEYQLRKTDESLFYCISGYGIRGSYVNRGFSINQREGNASSYGHIIIDAKGRSCDCGRKGCLAAYTSYNAIFKMIREGEQEAGEVSRHIANVDRLLEKLKTGDPLVEKIVLRSANYYGIGLANMINTLHPDVVILHGVLIHQWEKYFQEVVRSVTENLFGSSNRPEIIKGALKGEAPAIGAAIEIFLSELKSS
ncbi:ROK family transcriptional regulator [Evansella tamaricis]|uniref:ROK family transcriptional regulator n=1 Tax=Evansella tamaricis TaxID=2069301 RepID=A0ABS6JG15_9BACI|nr:ROK family transcriptional regulator [Evansella tamaricis]MBU9712588.1 ROK family transcriptional regulator [Evansella tamaricis]